MGNKQANGWPICNVCGDIIASWSESGQGHHDRCRRSVIPAGNVIVGGDNEGEAVGNIALIDGMTIDIIPEDESERCDSCGNDLCPDCGKPDKSILSRLAHLDAIEAAIDAVDKQAESFTMNTGTAEVLAKKAWNILDLIRKGKKDNE